MVVMLLLVLPLMGGADSNHQDCKIHAATITFTP
jgi:hypothetical protein